MDARRPHPAADPSPWAWIPTLYFAEGIPYFIVNNISVVMFKRLGMGNAELAAWTSLLYLPWVAKPLWSPLVDVVRSKRWWIVSMQLALAASFAATAFLLPSRVGAATGPFVPALVLFHLAAVLSATHDIAADGFYMLALDSHRQSLFVGIRSLFYRLAGIFGQGVLVVVAGLLEMRMGDIPRAWTATLLGCSEMLLLAGAWHLFSLPRAETREPAASRAGTGKDFLRAFATFFRKPFVLPALAFLLLYRLPEALALKMLSPFLLDSREAGGLGLSTAQTGIAFGTVGVVALTAGGLLGGFFAAKAGLRKALWPMAAALALPCAAYLYLALFPPEGMWPVCACVAADQFGYGFGWTAYMLFMMWFSEGEYATSHYAVCTAFMAASMMLPGFVAGALQERLGYAGFFALVMLACLATVAVTALLPGRIPASYGKKAPFRG